MIVLCLCGITFGVVKIFFLRFLAPPSSGTERCSVASAPTPQSASVRPPSSRPAKARRWSALGTPSRDSRSSFTDETEASEGSWSE